MNHEKLFFLPIICASLCISAENVRLLQKSEINKKIVAIEKKIVRDNYIKLGFKAITHAQEIYLFWSVFVSPLFANNVNVEPLKPLCEPCKEIAKTIVEEAAKNPIPFTTSLWTGFTNVAHNTKNLFTTPQGWWTIGGWGVYSGSCIVALYTALRLPHHFIYPDTLRWYYHTYAPYKTTTNDMKDAIVALQDQSLNAQEISNNKQILTDSLDRLARYAESICAYMAYKSKQLDEYERPVAERAVRNFFNYNNAWLKTIFAQCDLTNPDYDQINELVIAHELAMVAQLKHFYAIEGETEEDKSRVMRKIE